MISVKDLMTPVRSQAAPDTPLVQVVTTMRSNKNSCVLITREGRVCGIVTERDLVGLLALPETDPVSLRVSDVMTPDPVCVPETSSLLDALKLARSNNVRHLPVVNDEGMLVGMVTHTDMINVYVDILESQAELIDTNIQLRAQSREDPLLGIGNRRAMEGDLVKVAATAQRSVQPFALVLFDIDYFKAYNDHYGHVEGDICLKAVTQAIKSTMRHGDSLYRYGGEELLLLMSAADMEGASFAAERARRAVEELLLPHEESPFQRVTISGGIASSLQLTLDQLIGVADKALYQAKSQGRNRIAGHTGPIDHLSVDSLSSD
jgi:diguanylate cyclase (GGDEF)-like protein